MTDDYQYRKPVTKTREEREAWFAEQRAKIRREPSEKDSQPPLLQDRGAQLLGP